MIEPLSQHDLKVKAVIDGREGYWAMVTAPNNKRNPALDYDKVLNKLNELIETVNRLEEKVNGMAQS